MSPRACHTCSDDDERGASQQWRLGHAPAAPATPSSLFDHAQTTQTCSPMPSGKCTVVGSMHGHAGGWSYALRTCTVGQCVGIAVGQSVVVQGGGVGRGHFSSASWSAGESDVRQHIGQEGIPSPYCTSSYCTPSYCTSPYCTSVYCTVFRIESS